jgi:hypothetical protein
MALFEKRNVKEAGPSVTVAALSLEHDYHGQFSRWEARRDGCICSYFIVGGVTGNWGGSNVGR